MNLETSDFSGTRTDEREIKIRKVLSMRQPGLTVILENVHDPHNVSAVLRTCDAVGVMDVCLVYYGGQTFPRLGEKSSASARKWIRTRRFSDIGQCYSAMRLEGKKIFAANISEKSDSLYDPDLCQPLAFVFGNEHTGVSLEAGRLADCNFKIPQSGMVQSLNISVACAVSLYEAYRQRSLAGMYNIPQMKDNEFRLLFDEWMKK